MYCIILAIGTVIWFSFVYLLKRKSSPLKSIKLCIVLGSGGHSTEMLQMIKCLPPQYSPRVYIVSQQDELSKEKVLGLESKLENKINKDFYIELIPRPRKVGQSYFSSIFSTLMSFWFAFKCIKCNLPNMILCNGPGICLPIVISAVIINIFSFYSIKCIYVESFARVKTLSLTGKLIFFLVHKFIVQWPDLADDSRWLKGEYLGQIL